MIGGAEVAVAELSNALHNLGVEVTIIAPKYHKRNANSSLTADIRVKRLGLIPIIPFLPMVYTTVRFERSADVIHAHFLYPSGFAGLICKYILRKPCVVTMHGMDILVDKSIGYGMRLDWRLDLIIKLVLRNVDALIAPSKSIAREAIKAGADPSKVHVIPNGVDISRFNPSINGEEMRRELGIDRQEHVVLLVANFRPVKGYTYLVKAIPLILKEYPKTKFIFCGKGSDKQTIANMIKSLGLSENVILAGFIDNKEIPMYYAAADVFVLPSVVEGASIVILEALASGKPVVAPPTGSIPEVIRNGLSGILVDPADSVQLARAIIRYLENPRLRRTACRVGRKEIVQNYSWKAVADKTLTLYKSLL
jgi:glycosyltransferase involved in cell wall biosynthesis